MANANPFLPTPSLYDLSGTDIAAKWLKTPNELYGTGSSAYQSAVQVATQQGLQNVAGFQNQYGSMGAARSGAANAAYSQGMASPIAAAIAKMNEQKNAATQQIYDQLYGVQQAPSNAETTLLSEYLAKLGYTSNGTDNFSKPAAAEVNTANPTTQNELNTARMEQIKLAGIDATPIYYNNLIVGYTKNGVQYNMNNQRGQHNEFNNQWALTDSGTKYTDPTTGALVDQPGYRNGSAEPAAK